MQNTRTMSKIAPILLHNAQFWGAICNGVWNHSGHYQVHSFNPIMPQKIKCATNVHLTAHIYIYIYIKECIQGNYYLKVSLYALFQYAYLFTVSSLSGECILKMMCQLQLCIPLDFSLNWKSKMRNPFTQRVVSKIAEKENTLKKYIIQATLAY